jgi:hypothetical protein
MDPIPTRPAKAPTAPDDEQLGALVRATAEDWRLPPQRLDQPTWRDRVGGRSKRRRGGWFTRIAAPATAAVVGSVIVAFAAVWLTTPRTDQSAVGKSPGTSSVAPSAGVPSPSAAPTLPALLVNGALPDPAQVAVWAGGSYAIADLAHGTARTTGIRPADGPTTLLARPDGRWLCICGHWTSTLNGRPAGVDVSLESIDSDGVGVSRTVARTLVGRSDPAFSDDAQPELVDVGSIGASDGRHAFIGWSVKHGAAGWTSGIDVVDLATASVVSSAPLTVKEPTSGTDGRPTTRIAPRVELSPSGDTMLISSFWFVEDPSPTPPSGTDHWTASFDGSRIGALKPAGSTAGDRCGEFESGLIDATRYYVLCWTTGGTLVVERHVLDGTKIDATDVTPVASGMDGGSLVRRQGDRLFVWDPFMARLTRFDLLSAAVDTATGTAVVPSTGALDGLAAWGRQLGRWLAPPALAKVYLDPALVVSPDGTRVYAIGIEARSGADEDGSNGVFAFDASTLKPVGHWTPTADFVSLAISPDGRFVYAAGDAGRDAAGREARVPASITVYDTSDGSVRLIAGSLGSTTLSFPGPVAR